MTWCDKLASTPVAGFTLTPDYMPKAAIFKALAPILNRLLVGDKQKFTIDKQDEFEIAFTTDDGFSYGVNQKRLSVSFAYRMRPKLASGRVPTFELTTEPRLYTELLADVFVRLTEMARCITEGTGRKVDGVGIITLTRATVEDLPPGVSLLIDRITGPWDNKTDFYTFHTAGELTATREWKDRCIHTLIKPEDPEELPFAGFDWQRKFNVGRDTSESELRKTLEEARVAALAYFEELAEGERFNASNREGIE